MVGPAATAAAAAATTAAAAAAAATAATAGANAAATATTAAAVPAITAATAATANGTAASSPSHLVQPQWAGAARHVGGNLTRLPPTVKPAHGRQGRQADRANRAKCNVGVVLHVMYLAQATTRHRLSCARCAHACGMPGVNTPQNRMSIVGWCGVTRDSSPVVTFLGSTQPATLRQHELSPRFLSFLSSCSQAATLSPTPAPLTSCGRRQHATDRAVRCWPKPLTSNPTRHSPVVADGNGSPAVLPVSQALQLDLLLGRKQAVNPLIRYLHVRVRVLTRWLRLRLGVHNSNAGNT